MQKVSGADARSGNDWFKSGVGNAWVVAKTNNGKYDCSSSGMLSAF
jgi:hypothetical protein